MSKIICTGFVPFEGRSENSSSKVVSKLNNDIDKYYLEVSYNKTPLQVLNLLKENPDVLILTGEASGRKYVSLEKVAINLKSANICDNDGIKFIDTLINNSGETAYFSNVNVYEINDKLLELGFKSYVSLSAGSYICNLSYYTALEYINKNNLNTKVLFIHFPSEYDDEFVSVLEKIIEFIK